MLAAGIGPIGPIELVIILAIVIAIFGAGKLAGIGSALGQSVREFRATARELNELDKPAPSTKQVASGSTAIPSADTCTNCGVYLAAATKFCSECGTPIAAKTT